jgi:hypothetical protein
MDSCRRRFRFLATVTLAVTVVALVGAAGAVSERATANRMTRFTVYSVAKREQFIDNNDDESRGDVNNPFGMHDRNKAQVVEEHSNGPFPGDAAVFTFTLFSNPSRSRPDGSAVFTCLYYAARNAFCDAYFRFAGGDVLVGTGAFRFDATKYALAITGGYGGYVGAKGDVEAVVGSKLAQRLDFNLG